MRLSLQQLVKVSWATVLIALESFFTIGVSIKRHFSCSAEKWGMRDNAAVIGGSRVFYRMRAFVLLWGMDWGVGGVLSGGSGAVVVVLFLGLGHLGCLTQHSLGCWSRARVLRWGCPNIRPFQVAESPKFVHWLKSSFFLSLCLWCRPGYNSIWLLNGHLFQSFLNTLIFTSFLWNLWLPETKRPLVPQSFP